MADEIIKHHPNSSYYPYAIVLNRSSSELAVLQDALARFRRTFGELSTSIDAFGENPLPASYEIRLRPDASSLPS